jgi:hypothetical protein
MADAARQECHIDRDAAKEGLPLLKHGSIISQSHHLSGHQVHDGEWSNSRVTTWRIISTHRCVPPRS